MQQKNFFDVHEIQSPGFELGVYYVFNTWDIQSDTNTVNVTQNVML